MVALLALAASLIAPGGATASQEDGWYRVAFEQRIRSSDRQALDDAGARAVQYIPENAYVAWLDTAARDRVASRAGVSDVRPVAAGEKVSPALEGATGLRLLGVLAHRSAADALRSRLGSLGRVTLPRPAQPDGQVVELIVQADAALVGLVAQLPGVLHVGPASPGLAPLDEAGGQILAGNLSGTRPVPGYEDWLAEVRLSGAGVRVSVVDSGIDPLHPDLAGRIAGREDYSLSPAGEPVDSLGHGTHVAGIVAGNATAGEPVTRFRDDDGFLYGLGVAPEAELVDQNALSTTASLVLCASPNWPPPDGFEQLTRDALAHGAAVWNASWWTCEDSGGNYIASARTMDMLVRDGDWSTDEAEAFTMVFSAGNSGPQAQTVTSPTAAKNLIAVGSSLNSRAGNIDQISGFSSRGPAADGRILPTVVAPGERVVSAKSLATAGGVCSEPPRDAGAAFYSFCSGTSMAAPHVAGGVALTTEWWRNANDGADPSPAMTKALLVNSARPIARSGGQKLPIPNNDEGWGRMHLGALFDPTVERLFVDQDVVLEEVGETHEIEIEPVDTDRPLKITLAWTDAPGSAGADPALVNDLDLVVALLDEEGETVTSWLGNNFDVVWSVPDGDPDRLNNLENVFIEQPNGRYRLSVKAFNLPGDGVPGGSATDQDFALVVSNGTLVERPD